jgi:hypothetical protein
LNDTTNTNKFAAETLAPETQVGGRAGLSVELGTPLPHGQDKPAVHRERTGGLTAEVGADAPVREDDSDLDLSEEERAELAANKDGDKEAAGEDDGKGAPEALPEFDGAKADVVQAYEKRFTQEGGALNMEALSADWAANIKDNDSATGALSEGTYKFLESKGISREMAKSVERGEVAKARINAMEITERAGGNERYQDALVWARSGGYSKEAAAKFNKAIHSGDTESRNDAVDLLMSRFSSANPKSRRTSPNRTTSTGGSAPSGGASEVEGYKNHAEYRADFKKATDANNGKGDQKLLNENRRRLKASDWYTGKKSK